MRLGKIIREADGLFEFSRSLVSLAGLGQSDA
jgi:hypothetical protein